MSRNGRLKAAVLAWGILLPGLTACVTRTVEVPQEVQAPGVAPALVVERFLQAANAQDLETMARLFGTRDGSVLRRDPRREVEERMFAIASVLRHEDYALAGEGLVPGRSSEALRVFVRLRTTTREVVVPFTVVRTKRDGWMVEQIDLTPITGRG